MTYAILSNALELRSGAFFTILPGVAIEAGDLALFDLGGFLLPGRWDPDPDGDYILIPGYRIRITGALRVRILGRVLPIESDFKQFPPAAHPFPRHVGD